MYEREFAVISNPCLSSLAERTTGTDRSQSQRTFARERWSSRDSPPDATDWLQSATQRAPSELVAPQRRRHCCRHWRAQQRVWSAVADTQDIEIVRRLDLSAAAASTCIRHQ